MYRPKGFHRILYSGSHLPGGKDPDGIGAGGGIIVAEHERAESEKYRLPSRVRGHKTMSEVKTKNFAAEVYAVEEVQGEKLTDSL